MTARDEVDRLRSELREAERAMLAEREETRAATPVRYQYVIEPLDPTDHYKLYDSRAILYRISRRVLNAQEARDAQHAEHELAEGSMNYVFSTATYRIICAVGGGTFYIGPDYWGHGEPDEADDHAFERISKYLISHPMGGDITRIVEAYQEERRNGTN